MGKGLALQFKKLFPDMYLDYQERCLNKEVKPGEPYIYKGLTPPYIINFPTKDHWRSVSRLQDIMNGMEYLLKHYREWGITSIAMPALGCGNGQLEWKVVGPLLYYYLQQMDIDVEIYAPDQSLSLEDLEKMAAKVADDKKEPASHPNDRKRLPMGWIMLVEILYRLEQETYHYPVGRTIFQKIAFVATREGIPTGLNFGKNSYGPFSPDLKEVETVLVNSRLLQEKSVGRMFHVEVGPSYTGLREGILPHYEKWNKTIDKVVDLFMRVDTGQAEITAT
ncbi:MAG: macro domain-containing protein, partial [Fermentimonas sp.]|nr:macro domain-containing protein [Fermentimonas sp.]